MSNYNQFSRYYDNLTTNIDYNFHADYYDKIVKEFTDKKGILLDLACGTGSLCEAMAKKDYDVIGVDISEEMLNVAIEKKFDSGLPIQYLRQDMCKLDMFGTIDVIICALDSLNHLADKSCIKRALEHVSLFLDPNDGLFIFDVNTPYKHKQILGDNTFVYDTDQVYCVWQNSYENDDNKVQIDLTFFEQEDDKYYRYDESFCEIAFSQSEIKEMCEKSGLEVISVFDYMTKNSPFDKSEKLTFVTRKVK